MLVYGLEGVALWMYLYPCPSVSTKARMVKLCNIGPVLDHRALKHRELGLDIVLIIEQ